MMLGQVAEKNRRRLAIDEACGHGPSRISSPRTALNALFGVARNFRPLRFGRGFQNLRQHRRHCRGADNGAVRHLGKQIVIHRIDQIQLRALLHRLAQTLRDERMILAQCAADDQRGFQPGKSAIGIPSQGAPCRWCICAEIGLAQAVIDIAAAQSPHSFCSR